MLFPVSSQVENALFRKQVLAVLMNAHQAAALINHKTN